MPILKLQAFTSCWVLLMNVSFFDKSSAFYSSFRNVVGFSGVCISLSYGPLRCKYIRKWTTSRIFLQSFNEVPTLLNTFNGCFYVAERKGHVQKKVVVRGIAKIEKLHFFSKKRLHMKNFLVHQRHNSCYGYYEKIFLSKFDTKKCEDTKVILCYYCIDINIRWIFKDKHNWISELLTLYRKTDQ